MTGRLSEKIEKKIEARRKVNKGWFIPMDRLYRQYGVERESFHNRKFSGEPLKVLTKNAIGIFNDAKEILHQHKRSDVEDIVIEKICNETGSTLFAMHEMFSQLIISSPTQALGIAESSITPNAADSKIALALVTPTVTTVKTDNGVRIFRHLKSSGDDGMEGSL
mmetsp:Transcript_11489/g.19910  ORF Transcript_11489/g.19910 Transcript_11489/m.19910 type:complete len:165 (-) Transcript_11489:19-513(-)